MRRTLTAALLTLAAGCGGGDPGGNAQVSGAVTFKGQPVALGRVYFDIDQQKTPGGQSGFADIKDGRFDTAQGGKVPSAGPVTIRVEGLNPPGANGLHSLLFQPWETTAELPAGRSEKNLDVPASAGAKLPKNAGPPP